MGEPGPTSSVEMHYGLDYPGKAMVFGTGIQNNAESALAAAEVLSRTHGDSRVVVMNNQGHGLVAGIIETILLKFNVPLNSVKKTVEAVRLALTIAGPGGIVKYIGVSQGALLGANLKYYLNPEELKQVFIEAIGPATISSNEGFGGVENYVCLWDPVPLLCDPIGLLRSLFDSSYKVNYVKPQGNFFMIHSMSGKTYSSVFDKSGIEFVKRQ